MESTGVVRKIDDLGRIVIPKEIRKSLGIRDGESLEIIVENNNIKLTKRNIINNYLNDIKELCSVVGSIIPGTLLITDREKVTSVAGNIIEPIIGEKVSHELINIIDNRQVYNDIKIQKYKIGSIELTGYFLIYPIIDEGSPLGLVILYNDKGPVKEYEILIKFLVLMLSKKLDIS